MIRNVRLIFSATTSFLHLSPDLVRAGDSAVVRLREGYVRRERPRHYRRWRLLVDQSALVRCLFCSLRPDLCWRLDADRAASVEFVVNPRLIVDPVHHL